MSPQKVFMDSIHLWIVPAVLVALKVLFDLLPKPLFFAVVATAVGAFYVRKNMEQARNQRAAKEIEENTDSFLGELDSADKQRKDREAKKRAAKEQQRLEKIRQQEKLKRREESEKPKAEKYAPKEKAPASKDADEDADEMLIRYAANQKKR